MSEKLNRDTIQSEFNRLRPVAEDFVATLLKKIEATGQGYSDTLAETELMAGFSKKQKELFALIPKINPAEFGFKGQRLKEEPVPELAEISGQVYWPNEQKIEMSTKHLPKAVFAAYTQMAEAYEQASGRKLLIFSGYRSPAYQKVLIVFYLVNDYGYNLAETLRRVALPEYSAHCSASQTAIDFTNTEGAVNADNSYDEATEGFKKSAEYTWLKANAAKYGFSETYGANNPYGIVYEPWHWQYLATSESPA